MGWNMGSNCRRSNGRLRGNYIPAHNTYVLEGFIATLEGRTTA